MWTTGPSLRVQADGMRGTLSKAVSIAVAGAIAGATQDMRRQVSSYSGRFGKGRMGRVANAIRGDVYPKAPRHSLDAAGRVYARGAQAERIFAAFASGPVVTPTRARALAIPLHGERGVDGALLGPRSSFWGGRLTFIPASERGGLTIGVLAVERQGARRSDLRRQRTTRNRAAISARLDEFWVPQFVLVRAVRHPKSLNPEATMRDWTARVPGLIEQALRTMRDAA
jgi:hypothetical protein